MSDPQNDMQNQQDASDRTEAMTQAQQAGYGNPGGLDETVAGSTAGVTGDTDDATDALIDDGDEDGDPTLQSDMGDGMGSQSAAGAGSSGTGQTT